MTDLGIFNHNEDPARANGKVFRAVVAYDLNRLVSSVRGGRQEENAAQADQTPMLYLRGDADGRGIEDYVAGIEAIGAEALTGKVISGAGEFIAPRKTGGIRAGRARLCEERCVG
ncbi:hypothetical protein NKI59_30600 [Mesorhizobium sp. M0598]|uniref:hypothetical protein n=1 Tax=Mesorhizobium sp. M0598 TaxID=2956968 RepID=UPI00333C315B